MSEHERKRIRALAEQLKSADPTNGNLEGVMAVACLSLLDELEAAPALIAVSKAAERWDEANENSPETTAMADMHDAEKALHAAALAYQDVIARADAALAKAEPVKR